MDYSTDAHEDAFAVTWNEGKGAKGVIEVCCQKAGRQAALFCRALSGLKTYNMSPMTAVYISVDSLR